MQRLPLDMLTHANRTRFTNNDYTITRLPLGTKKEDVLNPAFWALHTTGDRPTLTKYDRVRVIDPAGYFDITLTVHDIGPGFAKMAVQYDTPIATGVGADEQSAREEYRDVKETTGPGIRFTPSTKWKVFGFGGAEVRSGLATKQEAEKVLEEYKDRVSA